MKRLLTLVLLTIGLASVQAAPFTVGNVVVLQSGTAGTGAAGALIEYTPSGTLVQTISLPNNGTTPDATSIVFGQNSAFNHSLSLSADGALVVIPGYANMLVSGVIDTVSVASGGANRVVGTVKYDGTYTRPFSSASVLSGVAFRTATSDGFGNFWGMGGSGGTWYLNTGTSLQSSTGRYVSLVDGNLCYTLGAGVLQFPGAPQSASSGTQIMTMNGTSPSATSFAVSTNLGIAYVGDVRTTGNGVERFDWNGSAWVFTYNLALPSPDRPQHVAVDFSGASPVIFAVNNSFNKLYVITDTGSGSTAAQIATPASGVFRGVTLAPTQPAAPVFTTQPTGDTKNYGETMVFGPVGATGANPNGWTWKHGTTTLSDGGTISGSTTTTLTISGLTAGDAGSYYAIAANNGGTTSSDPAVLTLQGSCINPQLVSITNAAGTTANFTAGVSGCQGPIASYSWTRDGNPVSDGTYWTGSVISGATTASLTISGVQDGDAGLYTVTLIDNNSQPSSSAATLTVVDPPSITLQPVSITKAAGTTANFSVEATGGSLHYNWFKNAAPLTDGLTGSGATIGGATTASLSIANVQDADAGTYSVTVTNLAGSQPSDPATLTVVHAPAVAALTSTNLWVGSNVVWQVVATGTPPLNYVWRRNGEVLFDDAHIAGASTDTLMLTDVQLADANTYSITVDNDYGQASSSAQLRIIIAGPQPSGIPGLVIYEPFNYPHQDYVQNAARNSFQDLVSTWNQVTGEPVWWERLGNGSSTVRYSGMPYWPGIDCSNDREWYWSSAPNNNHLRFGGIHQSSGAAYFSFVFNAGQGAAFGQTGANSTDKYDTIGGLTTGEGAANADNFVYRLCTHTCNSLDCNTFQLGIFKGGAGNPNASSVNGQWAPIDLYNGAWNTARGVGTHFIVGCYKFNSGTNLVGGSLTNDDVITLWIDPPLSSFGAGEGSLPAPSAGGMVTNWGPNAPITEFALKGTVSPASKTMTDLRIGTTWASVTHPYYPTIQYSHDAPSSSLTLKWPAKDSAALQEGNGYRLVEGLDLLNPLSWVLASGAVTQEGTNAVYGLGTSTNAAPFYRLVIP